VVFILTPSISSGGIQYSDMLNNVRKKRSKVQYEQSFQETLADPLGTTAYTERIERQAAAAEFESLKAQIEKAHAIDEMTRIKTELLDAAQEIRKERENVARARADVAKAENEAQKAKAEVTKVKKKATQTTKEAEELKRLLDELNRRLDTFSWRQKDNHQNKVEGEKVQSKAQKPDTENPTTDS
jgi:chromosome segregation ATPase